MKHLCLYICLISYTNNLEFYDYLVLPLIHCYFLLLSVTKYMLQQALKLFKKFANKNFAKGEYGFKMCTVKM